MARNLRQAGAAVVVTLIGVLGLAAAQGVPMIALSAAQDFDGRTGPGNGGSPDERARATEALMTDDERFSLLISLIGAVPAIGVPRDKRIPQDVDNMSAGYTPGVPRLGIPAIQSSDASMGVTNPGYRPDDKGATAFPSLVALGSSFNPQLVRAGGGGDRSRSADPGIQRPTCRRVQFGAGPT